MPEGLTSDPAFPATIGVGETKSFQLLASRTTAPRAYDITVRGAAGAVSHDARVQLTVTDPSDFDVRFTPNTVRARRGTTTTPVQIEVDPRAGFADTVTVAFSGLPLGVSAVPSTIVLPPGQRRSVTFGVAAAAVQGSYQVTMTATSGALSHQVHTDVEVIPPTYTYRSGSRLVLERVEGLDSIYIAVDTTLGGIVTAVALNGVSYVNAASGTRGVQAALTNFLTPYDCPTCGRNYNPAQGGDIYGHQARILATALGSDYIYIKAQPNHWYPDVRNGGPTTPALSDAIVEQWVYAVPGEPRAARVRYRVTRLGSTTLTAGGQWLPVLHAVRETGRLVRYDGSAPWTGGALTSSDPAPGTVPEVIGASEGWAAFANDRNDGIALYAPGAYRFFKAASDNGSTGPTGTGVSRLGAFAQFTLDPAQPLDADSYVVVGNVNEARLTIGRIRSSITARDNASPMAAQETPSAGEVLVGTTLVRGWAVDNVGVTRVAVVVDGRVVGTATLGQPRPDLVGAFPNVSPNGGWQYQLDTRMLSDGAHDLWTIASDAAGLSVVGSARTVFVNNRGSSSGPPSVTVSVGATEVVLRQPAVACKGNDLFDLPARAIRLADSSVALIVSSTDNYFNRGSSLTTLTHDCRSSLTSPESSRPDTFDNQYWIGALYRQSDTVHALVHNEFHDPAAPECKNLPNNASCVYNSLSYARSTDGARTFRTAQPPAQVVAAPHDKWDPTAPWKVVGYFTPTNIVRGLDEDYFYSVIAVRADQYDAAVSACLMRTRTLSDPTSWRAWDGTDFTITMRSAYGPSPEGRRCASIGVSQFGGATQSLTYNSYIGQYMMVYERGGPQGQCGFSYSLSRDLIHWTDPKVLVPIALPYCAGANGDRTNTAQYPSIIDPDAPDVNFETVGRTAYVYYVWFTADNNQARELRRVAISFSIP